MGRTVLPTKLQRPISPSRTLDRPRLNARLAEAFRAPLTVVAADAGFGKSTLVANFLSTDGRPSVWYRLDAEDSDPSTFTAHLLEGLKPHVSRHALSAASRGLGQVADWRAAAQLLTLTLLRLREDLLIVLDDFHLLEAATLSDGMTGLIEALPARAHLAILSRVLPALPLARWRARDRLAEIGTDDLRFTMDELRGLLLDVHALPLSDATLHVIAARTEGWPAGIMLALHAATAQGTEAAVQSLSTLSGSTRDIYDYLAQEAFTRQPPQTQRFLLATAAMARFSVALADAVLHTLTHENRAIIDDLERSHLFIVPLDTERRWYRYHHLFEEFLTRIGTERDTRWIQDVHRRAAEWWERRGDIEEALRHLIAAADSHQAARLLGDHGLDVVSRGQLETVRRWLDAIPAGVWRDTPRLYLLQGLTEVVAGATRQAVRSLGEARRLLRGSGDIEGEALSVRWLVNAAAWDGSLGSLTELLDEIAEIETRLPGNGTVARAHVHAAIGRVALWTGDVTTAEHRCRLAVETARTTGDVYTEIWCARVMGDVLSSAGRFTDAISLYEDVTARARHQNWWHEAAHLHTELAELLFWIGRDEDADRNLGEARMLQATIPCRVLQADVAHKDAWTAARRGARSRAEALLRELLGPGRDATPYGLWRFLATVDLSSLLAETDRDEATQLAARAIEAGDQFGPIRRGRALLAAGVAARSIDSCRRAAETFGELGASHWQALALLHAGTFARADGGHPVTEEIARVLRALTADGWRFLAAQAPPALLAPYRADPATAARIGSAMQLPAQAWISIRCLGPLAVIQHGQRLPDEAWPRAAPRRLLQYLLVQDRPVHREEVMEALWPGSEPRHAANQLRVALTHLRRVLEPDRRPGHPSQFLVTAGATIALARDRLDVDTDRFRGAVARAQSAKGAARHQALAEAVALYTGPLFADDPFEEWIQPQRDRLARQFLEVLTTLAETDEREGRHGAAVTHWLAVVEADPAAEHAYRGLIRCYSALGRGVDARRAFEACRKALAEVGADPAPETLALGRDIPR